MSANMRVSVMRLGAGPFRDFGRLPLPYGERESRRAVMLTRAYHERAKQWGMRRQ